MRYQEYPPPERLARYIECFWSHDWATQMQHRVLPDGCRDIIASNGSVISVGTMTTASVIDQVAGTRVFGVRFHPAMASRFVSARVDESISEGGRLARLLGDAEYIDEFIRIVTAEIRDQPEIGVVQCAAEWIRSHHGAIDIDELVRHCGVSARHLRRLFIEQTGVGPKMLARILRFRQAAAQVTRVRRDLAGVAIDCGYFDQAHLIRDFREFAGCTPGEYAMSLFSNRTPHHRP